MAKRDRGGLVDEKDKKKVTLSGLKKALAIYAYLWPYRGLFFIGLFFLTLSSTTVMVFPYVTGKLVDVSLGKLPGWDRDTVALAMMGILLVQAVFSFLRVLTFNTVSERAMRDIRLAVYSRIISLPTSFFEQRRVGELTSRLTSDVTQLQDVLSFTAAEFFRQIITLLVGVGVIFYTSSQLAWVMLSSFPVLIIGAIVFGRFIRSMSKKSTDELAAANVVVEETLQSVQTVKAFTNEGYEIGRYGTALTRVMVQSLKTARFRGLFISFIIFALFGGIVLVMWYGLGLVATGAMTIGDLVSFIIYTSFIGGAVGGMGDLYGQLQKTIGASERLLEILAQEPEVVTDRIPAKADSLKAVDISFKDVHFSYPTRPDLPILKGFDLEIKAGEQVALVGQSGAGKSTVAALLQRFYELNHGSIEVNGQRTKDMNISALRQMIGVVPQEVLLFGGSIKENIAYGRPGATEADIIQAAEMANAMEFINRFPEGLETLVGERGVKLSGGQRQRIAIARALLKNPAILILDEATSSLDAESERMVQEALETLMRGRTTVVIAHRLATIRQADKIAVIEDGVVTALGNHEALMTQAGGLYAQLIKLQFETTEV